MVSENRLFATATATDSFSIPNRWYGTAVLWPVAHLNMADDNDNGLDVRRAAGRNLKQLTNNRDVTLFVTGYEKRTLHRYRSHACLDPNGQRTTANIADCDLSLEPRRTEDYSLSLIYRASPCVLLFALVGIGRYLSYRQAPITLTSDPLYIQSRATLCTSIVL